MFSSLNKQQQQPCDYVPLELDCNLNRACSSPEQVQALNKPDEKSEQAQTRNDANVCEQTTNLKNGFEANQCVADSTNQTGSATPANGLQGCADENSTQAEQQNCNGSVPDDEELDEDVREAKANIKGYLDRIRETEKFIKSMHEEEDKLERQRRESFLFNNLLLSTKLNAFKSTKLEMGLTGGGVQNLETCGPYSAPVMMSRASYSTYNVDKPSLYTDVLSGGTNSMTNTTIDQLPLRNCGGSGGKSDWSHFETPVSCFSSNIYKPISNATSSLNVQLSTPNTFNYRDPLEPVQPIGMHAYAPTARNWRRSKSQLSDQFHNSSDSSSFLSTGKRQPLSATIDCQSASNPYFPSRHRRSVSNTRNHHHHHHSVSLISPPTTCNDHDNHDDQTLMMSEYKSSFGPNLSQDRRHQRHHSVAPSSSNRLHSLARATSPLLSAPLHSTSRLSSENESDHLDDDPEMSSYRPGSYKPRVSIENMPQTIDRGRSLGRLSGLSSITRGRSVSGTRGNVSATSDKDERQPTNTNSTRRKSVQTLASSSKFGIEKDDSDDATEWTSRRRSWTSTTNDKVQPGSASGSRLSELEQRIQANKRRREELLQGLNSTTGNEQRHGDRNKTVKSRCDDTDDDELDNSCGFERPSRPVERETALNEPSCTPSLTNVSELHENKRQASRLRPSRLESMEARIRRKSYCVKVRSPERASVRAKREQ